MPASAPAPRSRLGRLATLPPDALTPLIVVMLSSGFTKLRVGHKRRPRLSLRLELRVGDLFVTNTLTGLVVRATSPGPRARLLAEVTEGLQSYYDWLRGLVEAALVADPREGA